MTSEPPPPVPSASGLHPFDALVSLMARLRGEEGCPWDRKQDLHSLKAYAVEELYEVLDAIDSGDADRHRDELGDLLLQIVFQSQIRAEEGSFDVLDVCRAITEKMLRRHPELFGDQPRQDSAASAHRSWEAIKEQERRQASGGANSALQGVPRALPALLRSLRLSQKAAGQGFDWRCATDVLPKLHEELAEIEQAVQEHGNGHREVEAEIGDLLFAVCNLARHLEVNPEEALRGSADRFQSRFGHMEQQVQQQGGRLRDLSPPELESLWESAKSALAETA